MAGRFEIIDATDSGYRVRLLDSGGNVLAVSERYDNTESAARGILAIREIAASALIEDRRASRGASTSEHPSATDSPAEGGGVSGAADTR